MKKFKFEIPESVQAELNAREEDNAARIKSGVFQLEQSWSSDKRGVPSALLRSALFGIVRRGRREHMNGVEIASWANNSIKYTGTQLMQSDQDVWMACVEACRQQERTEIIIPQRELIRLAGRKGSDTRRIWNDLLRLRSATFEIRTKDYRYIGGLINNATLVEKTNHFCISIDPKMICVFGGQLTHIDTKKRSMLKIDLSKWMQGYASSHQCSHKKPHLVGLDKLQTLCGSTSTMKEFRRSIKKAMTELERAYLIKGWGLEKTVLKFWK